MQHIKRIVRSTPIVGSFMTQIWQRIHRLRRAWQQRQQQARHQQFVSQMIADFPGSQTYWEKRYQEGISSGPGSFGELARYKAQIVNDFVKQNNVQSVVDFGCGDGNQLALAEYPAYIGLDVSATVIANCRKKFAHDTSKRFEVYTPPTPPAVQAEMALSMEVIFHLTEETVYEAYMQHLFGSATRFVVIFGTDSDETPDLPTAYHVKHYPINRWIQTNQPHWQLRERITHPYTNRDSETYSMSTFYIYEREAAG